MSGKPNLLLDLDQTLISAEPDEQFDLKKHKERAAKFDFKDMDGYYIVFARPHLQEFLDYIFANFNVSVWTAASKDYALFIIDKMVVPKNKPERKLDFIFFSYHCDWSKCAKHGTKDLTMLWDIYNLPGYHKGNTIILDDYDEVKKTQVGNCVVAPAFEFTKKGSEDDTFLKELIPRLENLKKACKENIGVQIVPVDHVK